MGSHEDTKNTKIERQTPRPAPSQPDCRKREPQA